MSNNENLHRAKAEQNDEFYTALTDIEKELKNYKEHFKGKTVYCNCDDPKWSNFWMYFSLNFGRLGLKKLISTHYEKDKPSYYLEMTEGGQQCLPIPLQQNGDFRSPECIELLKQADIVVTNPPFSLFREYMAQLMEYEKEFLIIGPMHALGYKDIFPYIRANRLWLGVTHVNEFKMPDGNMKKFGNIVWYTNLIHERRKEGVILYEEYSPEKFPRYDNYDAIEVSKVADIPADYFEEEVIVETKEELDALLKELDRKGRIYTVEEM